MQGADEHEPRYRDCRGFEAYQAVGRSFRSGRHNCFIIHHVADSHNDAMQDGVSKER